MMAKIARSIGTTYNIEWQDAPDQTWYVSHFKIESSDQALKLASWLAARKLQRHRVVEVKKEVIETFDPAI